MKYILLYFLVIPAVFLLSNCKKVVPNFKEIILDDAAPERLWMKSVGDINKDGKTDLLVGGWNGGMVAYLAPDWKKLVINDTLKVSTDAEICDVNRDRNPDVVAVVNKAIVWLSGPDWVIHVIDSITGHDVEVGDFDGDGLLDVVMRNQGAFGAAGGHTLYFYYQRSGENWEKFAKEIPDGEGLKMADINGDDKPDIVVNGYWYENTGSGANWIEHCYSDTWAWPHTAIDVADINNDGLSDILLSPSELHGTYYRISWFEAPKDQTQKWKEHVIIDSIETVVHSINTADFNLDGRMDVLIAEMEQGEDPDEVAILYNLGNNKWEKQVISTGGSHSNRVGDFDGDGDMDAFGANHGANIVRLWVNELRQ